jgi:hypothetical protein
MTYIVYRNADDVSHFEMFDDLPCALIAHKLLIAKQTIELRDFVDDARDCKMHEMHVNNDNNIINVELRHNDDTRYNVSLCEIMRCAQTITY